jgi:hypothetical protein
VAGSSIRWSCTIDAVEPLPAGTKIGLARCWSADWGVPQTGRPDLPDHLAIASEPPIAIRHTALREPAWHPFEQLLLLELLDPLPEGGRILLRFGAEGPGHRVQTSAEQACPLLLRLRRPDEPGWLEIGRPTVRVVGGLPARLVVTAPSTVAAGEAFRVHLRLEDRFGNPAEGPAIEVELEGAAGPVRLGATNGAIARVPVGPLPPGVHRHAARDRTGLFAATSNPIDCRLDPPLRVFWGDLHGRSATSCDARGLRAGFEHAREVAALDFAGFIVDGCHLFARVWPELEAVSREFQAPGRFLSLLGCEGWGESGPGGDRKLYFPAEEGGLPGHRASRGPEGEPGSGPAQPSDLPARVRRRGVLGVLRADGWSVDPHRHEPDVERLLEVHSMHATSEWLLLEASARGWRLGVTAGSDGADGRTGSGRPGRMAVRNLASGLTAVALPELSRAALFETLRARRTWATTGPRILLELAVEGNPMGSEVRLEEPPSFTIRVEGTEPLESVELLRGACPVFAAPLAGEGLSDRLRVAWWGLSAPGDFTRARMVWDGGLEIEDGRILDARGWAFDSPEEGIVAQGPTGIAWRSLTAGDWDGVILRLQEGPRATLVVNTGPLACRLPLAGLGRTPRLVTAEDPPRRLELRRLPLRPPPPAWSGSFRDETVGPGTHAYWLRVVQADGERAWSSPIWVTVPPGRGPASGRDGVEVRR